MKDTLRLAGFRTLIPLALVTALAAGNGCTTAVEDAQRTPIGGVLSGKTTDTSSYLQEVERQNQQRQGQQAFPSGGGPPSPSRY